MKLLLVTQAVDRDDPVLGFFHRWIEEFATHAEGIHVVCLREGHHQLPKNVSVHSLGKESISREIMINHNFFQRVRYAVRFWKLTWKLRNEYDSVFVHMNQEYVLLGGIMWRMLGKRIVLWRNHAKGTFATRIASLLAHAVCYTSPAAYVAHYKNAVQMPIGIDTDAFKPSEVRRPEDSILFLGRLDPVKRVEVFFAALEMLDNKGVVFHADVYGSPSEGNDDYAHTVRNQAALLALKGKIVMHGAVANYDTPSIYATHATYVNLTPSGSFDKTIGEAMASGCVVVTANNAVKRVIPSELFIDDEDTSSVERALISALSLEESERSHISAHQRDYILAEHSLVRLTKRVIAVCAV